MKTCWILLLILLFPVSANAHNKPLLKKVYKLAEKFEVKRGKELFQKNGCAMCHGEDGSGNGPMASSLKNHPRNFQNYYEMHRMPDVRIEQAIREGLEGTAMPAFPDFSDKELIDLTQYLRSFMIDSYTTVDICLYEKSVLEASGAPQGYHVEVDEPERLEFKKRGDKITFQIKNWGKFLGKKSWRTHLRIMKGERIVSLVSIKVKPCLGKIEQLVKSLSE
ncbi:MAG: cytochrome c [Candidatus Nitronauta litoralis]|uniref:Cytochrome c n=1 Tax=Candidatus Nitronauta litoralis TaxID=2705533 RepID=A0A7T0BZ45_9BACT|nr:MAG: cytochrome c [Candidatus Nitronauta litoralis]